MGAAAAVGSVLTGVAGLLGVGSSAANQKKTNDANLQAVRETNQANFRINQMNNDFNQRMLEKQMEFNAQEADEARGYDWQKTQIGYQQQWDMWNADNAYNTPAAQRQRIQDAGYNPQLLTPQGSLATGSIDAASGSPGAASSGGASASGQIPMQAGRINPIDMSTMLATVVDAVTKVQNGFSQRNLQKEEAEQLRIENMYKGRQMMSEIADRYANAKNNNAKAFYTDQMREIDRMNKVAQLDQTMVETNRLNELFKQARIQTAMDRLTLEKFPQLLNQRIAENAARIVSLLSSGAASRAQAQRDFAQKIKLDAEAEGVRISNFKAFQLAGDVIEQTYTVTETMRKDLQNYISPRERGLWNIGAAAAAGVGATAVGRAGAKRPRSMTTRSYDPQRGWSGSQTVYEY